MWHMQWISATFRICNLKSLSSNVFALHLNVKKYYFWLIFLCLSPSVFAQNLGRGINLGNMFEAPSETAWGNPFQEAYIPQIAALGFQHIRIPIRWDVAERGLLVAPYTLNPTFLARIQSVVDLALKHNVYVIINMHHHEDLFTNPVVSKARFLRQWQQIATYFKGYNDKVLFEVLNEPHGNLTPALWNEFFAEALAEIRKTNPTRKVLLGTASYGGPAGVQDLNPPADPNLILSVHYYNPFTFTHQGADFAGFKDKYIGTKWEDLTWERELIKSEFAYAIQWAKEKKMPLHVGEFGSFELADMDSRARWTTFIARWLESQGASWAYWEYSAGFGIYNPQTKTFKTPLVDALLKNPLLGPNVLPTKNLYTFSSQAGWSLNLNAGASGSLVASAAQLKVLMMNITGTAWHIQLTRGGLPLAYKHRYVVRVKAQSDNLIPVNVYVGRSTNPYNAYSGNNSFVFGPQEKEFSFVFTMTDPNDANARLVFDMGTKLGNVQINAIQVDEIVEEIPLGTLEVGSAYQIFPNPFLDVIHVERLGSHHVRIFDLQGRIVHDADLRDAGSIPTQSLTPGTYLLQATASQTGETESHILQKMH